MSGIANPSKTPPVVNRLCQDEGVTFWDWLWAWTRDPVVWDWVRTTGAALLGALIGGLFTLWGQRQSAAQQVAREDAASKRHRLDALRDQSRDDAKTLFVAFTELHREIQTAPLTIGQHMNGQLWAPEWGKLWTRNRSLDLDVRARLLTDPDTRIKVQALVGYLDSASDFADGGDGGFPSPLSTNLHYMVSQLSAEGVELMGAYLRGEEHVTTRQPMWDDLARATMAYAEWEDYEIARMEALAEEQAEDIMRQENS